MSTLLVRNIHTLATMDAARRELRGEPGHRTEGMPEDVASVPFADRGAVTGGASEHAFQIGP